MSNLKNLKIRINSIKSTQKITKAMKMVSAAKLNKMRRQIEHSALYVKAMTKMVGNLSNNDDLSMFSSPLIIQNKDEQERHLIIVMTSDRGLCGAFNSNIVKAVKAEIKKLEQNGKSYLILCIGKIGHNLLYKKFQKNIIGMKYFSSKDRINFSLAEETTREILGLLNEQRFNVCTAFFYTFETAVKQTITKKRLIPIERMEYQIEGRGLQNDCIYEYEPSSQEILENLLPKNLAVQIYHVMLENMASEHASRMNAMENASKNADEIVKDLGIKYNRTRQALITKELIEIISGAESV